MTIDIVRQQMTKRRNEKHSKQEQVQQKVSDALRLERACKSLNLDGAIPPGQVETILRNYIQNLQKLKNELTERYGMSSEFFRIDSEITEALSQITRLRITNLRPGEKAKQARFRREREQTFMGREE